MPSQSEYNGWLTSLDDILVLTTNTGIIAHAAALRQGILRSKQADAQLTDDLKSFHDLPTKLPAIRPQPGKRVKTRDIPCPTCFATPGSGCFEMDRRGPGSVPTTSPKVGYHITRSRRAKEVSK